MSIVRLYTGDDGRFHFQDIVPQLKPRQGGWPMDAEALVRQESGIFTIRFDANRFNPWHLAPGRMCVFTLSGAVEIEVGDGGKRTLGAGDVLIAEDVTGQGHYIREVGSEPRVSLFVPLNVSSP